MNNGRALFTFVEEINGRKEFYKRFSEAREGDSNGLLDIPVYKPNECIPLNVEYENPSTTKVI